MKEAGAFGECFSFFMPPDLALLSTLIGSNYTYLELIFMVPKMFEPLKFYCMTCVCIFVFQLT